MLNTPSIMLHVKFIYILINNRQILLKLFMRIRPKKKWALVIKA